MRGSYKKPMASATNISGSLRKRIDEVLRHPKRKTVTVLSSLIAIQDELGYVPEEGVPAVAEVTGASINDIYGVLTFYTHFRLNPPAKYNVEVCWGLACHTVGASEVMRVVQDELGFLAQGESPDGQWSLKRNSCVAACAHGPAITINHRVYGDLTPEKALRLLRNLKNGGSPKG